MNNYEGEEDITIYETD